jgi:hypothetical protein
MDPHDGVASSATTGHSPGQALDENAISLGCYAATHSAGIGQRSRPACSCGALVEKRIEVTRARDMT